MTKLDPVTVEIIGSALTSIVEEMGEALVRSSFSTNIKERRDCSTALFDRRGYTLCQAEHIPMHLGSFLGVIPEIRKRCDPANIHPGDVFIANDAYEGGATHLPDIVLAEPIYVGDLLAGWAVNTAHHSDFADRGHRHIYQEGLRIPPVRLCRKGVWKNDILDIFLTNCQVPDERMSDLRAQMSANRLCVQRMKGLCEKYGINTVLAAGDALQDYAERKMRAGISEIPNGTYRFWDTFDSNQYSEPLEIEVAVTIDGSNMTLDFDAPPQVPAGLNMVYTALLATCYYVVKSIVDPTIIPNAGLARPLTVSAPIGSILNCNHPAAVDGRVATCQRVADVVQGALAEALPGKVCAAGNGCCTGAMFSGTRTDGSTWVYIETMGGGGPARPTADGLSGIHVHLTNTSNLPVEALETEYPLSILRYELVDGSSGPGKYRGGMGIRRVYQIDDDCRISVDASRVSSRPWGLEGGIPGEPTRLNIGARRQECSGTIDLRTGQLVEIITPGGGGYGPPSERDVESVGRDIREGRVSKNRAAEIYRHAC